MPRQKFRNFRHTACSWRSNVDQSAPVAWTKVFARERRAAYGWPGPGLYLSNFIRGGVEVLAIDVDDRANA